MPLTDAQKTAITAALNAISDDVLPKIQAYVNDQSDENLNALIFGTIKSVIDVVKAVIV
jgi:hypothetical protein